jgi:serine/threonine-protein kinase RsbW
VAESAPRARRLVEAVLQTWDVPHLAEAALVVVTELVANAAYHARAESIRVTVTRLDERAVRVAVVDKSRALPHLRPASPGEEHGRGLVLVEAMSARWGVDTLPWGKRVWAELEDL